MFTPKFNCEALWDFYGPKITIQQKFIKRFVQYTWNRPWIDRPLESGVNSLRKAEQSCKAKPVRVGVNFNNCWPNSARWWANSHKSPDKINEIVVELDLSYGSVHSIIHKHLNFNKDCARWVPRSLTVAYRNQRFRSSFDLLERYSAKGAHFLSRIITADETWVHNFTPESKSASMIWKRLNSPTTKNSKLLVWLFNYHYYYLTLIILLFSIDYIII